MGWGIAGSSVMMIPGMGIYKMLTAKGTFMQRLKFLTTPVKDQQINANGVNQQVVSDPAQVRLNSTNANEGEDV